MGFIAGFTGGATLVLGATYLALTTHSHNRHSQSDHLRSQTAQVNLLARESLAPRKRDPAVDEILFPLPRAEQRRADVVEAAKDRWNAEIEGAVRWAQTRDWVGWERDAVEMVPEVTERAAEGARYLGGEVKHLGGEGVKVLGEGVKHLGEEVKGAVERGVVKGRDMVGRARARVHLAEDRLEARMDAKLLHQSDVEKALAERFEKRGEDTRTVKEVLAERYKPISEKDHSRLWGV
ncbi:hypothetical protein QBC39DRAFT_339056 [Podospora conica]|nr:hypothetical protein QBC39DRAFT_339056 [Schizothecium conicum]